MLSDYAALNIDSQAVPVNIVPAQRKQLRHTQTETCLNHDHRAKRFRQLAARTCVAQVHEWERQFNIQNPVECIFEKGDLEQDKFTELVTEEGGDPPIYRNKKDYAGLQGADQYAWEQFHYLKKARTGEHIPARGSFKFLLNLIPCIHAQVTQESIIHVCEKKGIDPRTGIKK